MSHADRTEAATALTRRRLMLMTSAAATATTALMPRGALATVQVQITQGNVQAMPIAIPDFLAGPGAEGDMPRNITQIIT
ncbi:MAG: Tol-Pal system protein TolB, partial [Xanthobacteraceae bacterium]